VKKAIFLNSDGTLIRDLGCINNPNHVELVDGVINTLKFLQSKAYLLIIIGNQFDTYQHFKLLSFLKENNIKIDDMYYFSYNDDKYIIKFFSESIFYEEKEFKINLDRSFMISDKLSDVEAGNRTGCKTIFINNDYKKLIGINKENCPSFITRNWNEILNYILSTEIKNDRLFDTSQLILKSISEREHDYKLSNIKPLQKTNSYPENIKNIALKIIKIRKNYDNIIFMMGAHVIKCGLQKYIIDLLEKNYITCISTNGASVIHDYEFSLIGSTSENVQKYLSNGEFGLWEETGEINNIINKSYDNEKVGIGEAIGEAICNNNQYKDISIFANCYYLNIPITVHVGIGYDIIHQHPNFDAAKTGYMSYIDFLKFTKIVEYLDNGILMSFGSAVMAPEIFLKSLNMVRNIKKQKNKHIENFTTVVCDLHDLPKDLKTIPEKNDPLNFFRPWKNILSRPSSDNSFYIKGRHEEVIPQLWTAINDLENMNGE
jgi:HAD superfamily hydrolase (TIGR01662 family)